ncbi:MULTISPECIES: LuxR family transcriptional regulator [unclassified Streptomyces]|uniref:helix-turn-helix transcriptional regulator n=1 Tax=unclassified Streptomyces TaxID=2593676 RepID=UPI0022531FC0|nr:AAA family ATPase [Streptomyces sp. NBC_00198]MCX5280941.1 AAA family ATPase [Streptomyces sp. NBC_00198]
MRTPPNVPRGRRAAELTGRHVECGELDRVLGDVRSGGSQALVVHGEPGAGKTALLEYTAVQALGFRVLRAVGVQSEMELVFAGLHQLCSPVLDLLDRIPSPQRDALRTAFGLSAGPPPDRFLVGLALLSLLSEAAGPHPLICLVDDLQWLDKASAQALAFVARRLGRESIALVFATRRRDTAELAGVPDLPVDGLQEAEARSLLNAVLGVPIDARVRDQIILEARGNPLALRELARGLTPTELAGGFGFPGVAPLANGIEETFQRRVEALPPQTRTLLLIAAADPSGDPALLWRAAGRLGVDSAAAAPAADADLAEFGARVRFRHPVARSAAYRGASAHQRRAAHQALAETTDQQLDPDRYAWHRAQAAVGPDENVATELDGSADRARARGGLAAAAAFLRRAAVLTVDPAQRAGRALAAAQAETQAGAFEAARDLLAMTELGPLTPLQQANADVLRAQLAFITSRGGDAPILLLRAAKQLEPIDVTLSRATYLDALSAAVFAGRLASPGGHVGEAASAASTAPPPLHSASDPDLLLEGTAAALNTEYAAGVPTLQRALADFGAGMTNEEELRWMWLAAITAIRLWDDIIWDQLSIRYLQLARETGALSELPLALTQRAYTLLFAGDLPAAAALIDELQVAKEATGSGLAPYGAMALAALRGDEDGVAALTAATLQDATQRGEGIGITFAEWAKALLFNGLGRYEEAVAAGQNATSYDKDLAALCWPLPELVEAAARCGMKDVATKACDQLGEMARAARSDWVLGVEARSRAQLTDDDSAEPLHLEAIARLGKTRLRVDLARAHLLYGEWLRRRRRRGDARKHLSTAHTMLKEMGVTAFAERAARELRAAGGNAGRRVPPAGNETLTPQEAQIARMARDGLSNPEIGSRLFISARTVQYHLRKVFTKLGIVSRSQLDSVLATGPTDVTRPVSADHEARA